MERVKQRATVRCAWPLVLVMLGSGGCAALRIKREVFVANDQLQRAMNAHDVAAMTALTAPEFRAQTYDGHVDREQWIALVLRQHIIAGDGGPISIDVERRDLVYVCGQQRREAIGLVGEFCDDWVKRDGRWQLLSWVPVFYAL